MDNEFYEKFKRIIRECNYDNTYKMAWAKALVEISLENSVQDDIVEIKLQDIAKKYIKYYWNQTIFFDLIQGSNMLKTPVIVQNVKKLIEEYYKYKKCRKPERFERIEFLFDKELKYEYETCVNKIITTLRADVSWRFIIIDGKNNMDVYEYLKDKNIIRIRNENLKTLAKNNQDLFDIINYRWGLILENFNSSPKINKKVRIIDEQDVKRNSLTRFREYLDIENPNRTCFICGKKIEDKDLSIDHVIPWSYLYSDDLWNLVYVHKNCNSSKNNVIPSEQDIRKLENRNTILSKLLVKSEKKGKNVDELNLAIEKDYIKKFWIGCKS